MNRAMRRHMRLDAAGYAREFERTGFAARARFDANETMSFSRSLEAIDEKLYRLQYPELKGTLLVPVIGNIPGGAEEYTYRFADEYGQARVTANLANDVPRVDVAAAEVTSAIVSVTAAYGYSVQDGRRSALTGIPLDEERALTARRSIARKINDLLLLGDTTVGLVGLYKSAAVQTVNVVTGTWSTATAEQMLGDLLALEREVIVDTKGIERPDTLVMPPSLYARATTARLSNTETTALAFFLKNSLSVKNVEVDPLLETAGASSVARLVVYTRNPEKLGAVLPIEFEQLPPEAQGFEFVINCHARCGGTVIRYPGSVAYMDGC